MNNCGVIRVSLELDRAGLVWQPVIGDEVVEREDLAHVSIFVDPQGLTPIQLRGFFLWLPSVEQLVEEFEARQFQLYHLGMSGADNYDVVLKSHRIVIESSALSLREALGRALQNLLINYGQLGYVH